jgi:hypothetical protein
MWQILADGLDTGHTKDLEAWEQYERASNGRSRSRSPAGNAAATGSPRKSRTTRSRTATWVARM